LALFALVMMSASAFAADPGAVYPPPSEVSDQKAGSVLFYNFYISAATSAGANAENTRINITNTSSTSAAFVHLFFVDGMSCSVADSFICLTANQTASFMTSDVDPGFRGYIIAIAIDGVLGCPVAFNHLIGDEYFKTSSGHAANLNAEAFSALYEGMLPGCNADSTTAALVFDGKPGGYNRAPRALALSNVPSKVDGNDTQVIINRFGGNLGTGASTLGNLFGMFYDDAENILSFSFSESACQLRRSLSNNFPRLAPRFETFIPHGRSGWAKVWSSVDIDGGLLGAMINYNPAAARQSEAFNGGHNLHKLTLSSANTYTIPIFPPSC
jgi:hypothetical protein